MWASEKSRLDTTLPVVPSEIPHFVDWGLARDEIEQLCCSRAVLVSSLSENLEDDREWLTIGELNSFPPTSIRELPRDFLDALLAACKKSTHVLKRHCRRLAAGVLSESHECASLTSCLRVIKLVAVLTQVTQSVLPFLSH